MYTAIVLSNISRRKLLDSVSTVIIGAVTEQAWPEVHCHHCTLHMGSAKEDDNVGQAVELTADAIGFAGARVCAVRVKLPAHVKCANATPHITLFVNRDNGGKPKHSNEIKDWKPHGPITLTGTVEQCQ